MSTAHIMFFHMDVEVAITSCSGKTFSRSIRDWVPLFKKIIVSTFILLPLTQSYSNKNTCTDIILGSDGEVAITACPFGGSLPFDSGLGHLFIIVIMIF